MTKGARPSLIMKLLACRPNHLSFLACPGQTPRSTDSGCGTPRTVWQAKILLSKKQRGPLPAFNRYQYRMTLCFSGPAENHRRKELNIARLRYSSASVPFPRHPYRRTRIWTFVASFTALFSTFLFLPFTTLPPIRLIFGNHELAALQIIRLPLLNAAYNQDRPHFLLPLFARPGQYPPSEQDPEQWPARFRSRSNLFSPGTTQGDMSFGRAKLVCLPHKPHPSDEITDNLTPRLKMASL